MIRKKSFNSHCNEQFQQPHLQQIPNRSNSHTATDDELNKNISSEYQEIQLRTLQKWINVQLVDDPITSINTDLKDGKKLLKLLSVVAKNSSLKPEKGNMRIHHLSNVAQALNFLKEQWGVDSLPAIANESIVNGDVKSTCAIVFFIMLKYQIHPILLNNASAGFKNPPSSPLPGVTDSRVRPTAEAKLVLLYWVRSQLNDYISNNIITNIQDFSRSWRSGLAFCLLIHRHDPDIVSTLFTDLIQQPTSRTLLTLAFDVAETQLNIPRYLDPEDLLVEFPHEPSVMMYISEMFNVMTKDNSDTKREKRLQDIALLRSTDSDDSLTLYDPMTPSDSSTRSSDLTELDDFGQFNDIVPKDDLGQPLHPLDGTLDIADTFETSLSHVNDDQTDDFKAVQNWCYLFRRGVMFAQITTAIHEEIQVIQELMSNSTVDSALVHSLEQRVYVVNTTLQGVCDEYRQDLLSNDIRYIHCIDHLEEQHEQVSHWVNQVRVWFGEAERIRDWIDKHIQLITSRNEMNTSFDPVSREVSIDESKAYELYQEHETLKQEIDGFDSADMTRLKAHVKMITTDELTPADTSTVEITLTTLNLLSRLTQLLNSRSRYIQLLLLRLKWEDVFGGAIQWIANTDRQMDIFLRDNARWSESTTNEGVEDIIATLVSLERQISDFDHGSYSHVLDAYQELENTFNEKLPEYLEHRQVGFEKAFEDLMKRTSFSRQVVEQLLAMISTVEKFKELRQQGENLRNHTSLDEEQVQLFKEESALLITNASTYIPYPVVPKMSTAIGANDAHDTEITNENIKSTLSTYSMALALIADVLDQLLISQYQVTSLQSRADTALSTMTRLKTWMDERVVILHKTDFQALLYDSVMSLESEELYRLDKERDSILQKLYQMENDELVKCYNHVQELEKDIDASNAVSIDRYSLVVSVEDLEKSHKSLKTVLRHHGLYLDSLKKRQDWENQATKANTHTQTLSRKLHDFCNKKALYDPATENVDKPSYQGDREIRQALHSIQEKIVELEERFLEPLQHSFQKLKESYDTLAELNDGGLLPDAITVQQHELLVKYNDLKQYSIYTADVVTQRATITEFLLRVQDACQEGEKIKDAFAKKTRHIMVEDGAFALTERMNKFKQEISNIWSDCGESMVYPQTNASIKELLDTKMKVLYTLGAAIDEYVDSYNNANQMKMLVIQYEQEASELGKWIDTQVESLKRQYIDVSAECFSPNLSELNQEQNMMVSSIDDFENNKVKLLHDTIVDYLNDSDKQKTVDISPAASKFAQMMDQLSHLKQGLADQSIALDAASKRMEWEKHLHSGITALESMNEQVRQFTIKKNQVISQDELTYDQVQELETDLSHLIQEKNVLQTTVLIDIQSSYDTFIECFPKLSKPIATPDHLELRMESLNGLSTRLQENMDHRSEELNLLRQRLDWEELAKQTLVYISKQEQIIEDFVEEKARWNSELAAETPTELRQEWSTLCSNFKDYEVSVIKPLKQQCEHLINEMAIHTSCSGVLTRKLDTVQKAQDGANHSLDFSGKVVDQRYLVTAFIQKSQQLEQSADTIRKDIASINLNTAQLVDVFESHSKKLDNFKTGVQDVQDSLVAKIPFPIRTKRDESTNSTIRETVHLHSTRLDELLSSLQQLLESKERTSRKTLSLHYYKKQVVVTETWVDGCQQVLLLESENIKKLVTEYSHIEQTMMSDDNVFTALVSVYNKCVMAFKEDQDEEQSLVDEFHSFVQPTQSRLCQSWDSLLDKVVAAKRNCQIQFIVVSVQFWLESLNKLWDTVNTTDEQTVTNDQLDAFLTELAQLENENLGTDLEICMKLYQDEQLDVSFQSLQEGLDVAKRTKTAIQSLKIQVCLLKLIENFTVAAAELDQQIQEHTVLLVTIYKNHEIISIEHYQHEELTAKYVNTTESVATLKDAFLNVTKQYQSIVEQDGSFISQVYENVKNGWDNLLAQQSKLELLVSRSLKWAPILELSRNVRADMQSIATMTNQDLVAETISRLELVLCNDLQITDASLLEDTTNFNTFEQEHTRLSLQLDKMKNSIQENQKLHQKQQLIQSVQVKVSELQKMVCDQFGVAERYCERFCLASQHLAQQVMNDNNAIISLYQQELSSLRMNQCSKLTREYNWSESQVDQVLDPVTQALKKLVFLTFTEQQHMDLGDKSNRYNSCQSQVLDTIEKYIDKLETTKKAEVSDLECQFDSLREAAQRLETLYDDVFQGKQDCCFDGVLKKSNERQKSVTELLDKAKKLLEKTLKRQEMIAKLNRLLKFVQDMTDKVSSFKAVAGKETEFNEMCAEFYALLKTKRSQIDTTNLEDKTHYDRLLESISNLDSLIDLKKKEFKQPDISRIFIDFEKHITSLISIIDKSSPSHANIINNKFVRSDLQQLLKNLVQAFKQHKTIINDIVDQAIIESKRHDVVANELQNMKRRWAKIQSAASARERELKTCINKLDHEFFTKLAIAKTKPQPSVRVERKLYVPNPDNELDVKLGQIINSYKVTVKDVPGQIGKYWFGDVNPRLVYCRILPSKLVMVRVGGGWVELSKFLREHGFIDNCSRPASVNENRDHQEHKRPMSPANRITIRGGGGIHISSSSSLLRRSSSKVTLNSPVPGYVDGDRFVSIDENGQPYFVKMKKASDDAKTPIISKKKH